MIADRRDGQDCAINEQMPGNVMRLMLFSLNRLFAEARVNGLSRQRGVESANFEPMVEGVLAALADQDVSAILVDLCNPRAMADVKRILAAARDLCVICLAIDFGLSRAGA